MLDKAHIKLACAAALFAGLLVAHRANGQVSNMKKEMFWYRGNCRSAEVEFYRAASDYAAQRTKKISDPKKIEEITSLLDRLPVVGDIMIKLGPTASHIKLILNCDTSDYEIHFYADKLRTPDTSFFSDHKPEELALISLLKAANESP
jgi:hypothetical protein